MLHLSQSKIAIAILGNLSFALALCTYKIMIKVRLNPTPTPELCGSIQSPNSLSATIYPPMHRARCSVGGAIQQQRKRHPDQGEEGVPIQRNESPSQRQGGPHQRFLVMAWTGAWGCMGTFPSSCPHADAASGGRLCAMYGERHCVIWGNVRTDTRSCPACLQKPLFLNLEAMTPKDLNSSQLFLGSLREAEVERINDRMSQAIMETCLAMTIFREGFNIEFCAMFTVRL